MNEEDGAHNSDADCASFADETQASEDALLSFGYHPLYSLHDHCCRHHRISYTNRGNQSQISLLYQFTVRHNSQATD